jgi:hypothetical protein
MVGVGVACPDKVFKWSMASCNTLQQQPPRSQSALLQLQHNKPPGAAPPHAPKSHITFKGVTCCDRSSSPCRPERGTAARQSTASP